MEDQDAYIASLEDLVRQLESELRRLREEANPPVQRSFDFDVHED